MIRQFRRYVKNIVLKNIPKNAIHSGSSVEQRATYYARAMGVPTNFLHSEKAGFAILLMVESSKVTKQRQLISSIKIPMKKHLTEITAHFFEIFYENSKKTRLSFFVDPLVQYLWTKFRENCKQDFSDYIRDTLSQVQGKVKVKRFI